MSGAGGWQPRVSAEQIERVRGYRVLNEIVPARWAEGSVEANGARHHYWRTGGDGDKAVVVLLHGILAGGLTWTRVAKALDPDFDLVLLDARGHGGTVGSVEGYSYATLTQDVVGVIAALGLERPSLLGHSLGGVTAALVAARHPDLVRSIVVEDAAWGSEQRSRGEAIGQSEGYNAWLSAYIGYLEQLKTQAHSEQMAAALAQMLPGSTAWPEEEYVPWVAAQAALDLDLVRQGPVLWNGMALDEPLSELVREITCPMLLLTGNAARGGSGRPEITDAVVEHGRDVRHVHFEEAGHLIHLDAYERFIEVARAFLMEQA
jgi:pimeloyl-ACP methyl ester carboxylesterase